MPLPPIKDIIKTYGLSADKKLGQNFLFDQNLTDKIVNNAGNLNNKTVIEIGPGPGLLTRSILSSNAKQIIAIEKDKRCIAALNDYLVPQSSGRLTIIEQDAINMQAHKLATGKVHIIANLPYNISTQLLLNWLDNIDNFTGFTLMFQREVALRILAQPKSKNYGRLSIKTQLLCEVEHIFDLPPSAFFPPPKVTSSVINITPRATPLMQVNMKNLEKLCKIVFGQRRKTLRSSLKKMVKDPLSILNDAGIDQMKRPEELSIEELCILTNVLDNNQ